MQKADVIIFGGQSNMQGETERLSNTNVVENAVEYKYLTDTLVPLHNPVGEDIRFDGKPGEPFTKETNQSEWLQNHVTGSSAFGYTNLVPSFCEAYVQETGRNAVAVHIAKGSTRIEYWIPETDAYNLLIKKASAAVKKAKENFEIGNVFFVWLQGESNALKQTPEQEYLDNLIRLKNGLKKEVGIDKFGIIKVGYFAINAGWVSGEREEKKVWDETIMSAQEKAVERDNDFIMLTRICPELSLGTEYMNPYVVGHYSAAGLEKIGAAAGKALGKL